MERVLNDEDKIRRAEEIYYRRNNQISNFDTKSKAKSTKNSFLLNLILMFDIAVIIFCVQNKEFIFTKEFLNVLNQYNIEASSKVIEFFNNIINEENSLENEAEKINEKQNENVVEEKNEVTEVIENVVPNENEVLSSSLDEMEIDIQNLKAAYSFINPLKGVISSTFGARESKYQNVAGYHTGIDLAADTGTTINASMQGIVEIVSSEGDYGKHIKIRCNNITTLYAHCSKIYVKQGQIVAQGDKIAAVGSTGNSTGPHLHFEIRVDDRFVDPAKIIDFN